MELRVFDGKPVTNQEMRRIELHKYVSYLVS
jgi:hypothetical protein